MIYLQLNDSKTLRCCITELQNDIDIDSNIYVPSLSQLSRKNSTRDYIIFEYIFYYILKKLKKKLGVKEFNSQFKQIKAFHSTIIDIETKLAPDLYFDKDISAIKMSTLFNLPVQDILELYKMRCPIELFFKWIKQNLRIKHGIDHNENSIKIQLYSSLIAYILIRLVQEEIDNRYSILKITRIIRVYITKKVNLLSVFIS